MNSGTAGVAAGVQGTLQERVNVDCLNENILGPFVWSVCLVRLSGVLKGETCEASDFSTDGSRFKPTSCGQFFLKFDL